MRFLLPAALAFLLLVALAVALMTGPAKATPYTVSSLGLLWNLDHPAGRQLRHPAVLHGSINRNNLRIGENERSPLGFPPNL